MAKILDLKPKLPKRPPRVAKSPNTSILWITNRELADELRARLDGEQFKTESDVIARAVEWYLGLAPKSADPR